MPMSYDPLSNAIGGLSGSGWGGGSPQVRQSPSTSPRTPLGGSWGSGGGGSWGINQPQGDNPPPSADPNVNPNYSPGGNWLDFRRNQVTDYRYPLAGLPSPVNIPREDPLASDSPLPPGIRVDTLPQPLPGTPGNTMPTPITQPQQPSTGGGGYIDPLSGRRIIGGGW